MIRFDVFGNGIGVQRSGLGWTTECLGNEGKRQSRDFVILELVAEGYVGQHCADLFHKSAWSECPDLKRAGPDRGDES